MTVKFFFLFLCSWRHEWLDHVELRFKIHHCCKNTDWGRLFFFRIIHIPSKPWQALQLQNFNWNKIKLFLCNMIEKRHLKPPCVFVCLGFDQDPFNMLAYYIKSKNVSNSLTLCVLKMFFNSNNLIIFWYLHYSITSRAWY